MKKKERKRLRDGGEEGGRQGGLLLPEEEGSALVSLLLTSLTKCFQYDDEEEGEGGREGGFLSQSRFEGILPYVVGLISDLKPLLSSSSSSSSPPSSSYFSVARGKLIPCLAHMALAVGKDVLWKPYHHQVLMKTRDKDWEVRFVALQAVKETFMCVGEEYLAMLPESIAYLSELMEDEREEVVVLCKETIGYIEDLSGESLESYLA